MAINWKNRAKRFEQEALAKHDSIIKIAFCLEKERALRRRADEKSLILASVVERACAALEGAAENMRGAGRAASARELGNVLYDLRMRLLGRAQGAAMTAKDEQR